MIALESTEGRLLLGSQTEWFVLAARAMIHARYFSRLDHASQNNQSQLIGMVNIYFRETVVGL